MKVSDADILIVPGLGGSGPDHWQSRWQSKLPNARRIELADWDAPDPSAWARAIEAAAAVGERPIVLVSHSLGSVASAMAAPALAGRNVRGAFLVTPPSAERLAGAGFAGPTTWWPRAPLPFASIVVASRDDPWAAFADSEKLAAQWGSTLADAGACGHLNAESGHGPWPEGLIRFAGFLRAL